MNSTIHPLIIIGSGPAGLTAGIYAGRARLKPIILEGAEPGGQLMRTTAVENWPGTPSIMGPDLMIGMQQHAQKCGAICMQETVTAVDLHQRPFHITTTVQSWYAHSLIIATGATPKRLGCPGEEQYWAKGVSTCAICDGAFYQDKRMVIVGGGDTAMENASFLTNFSNNITIINLGPTLTASGAMQERILANPAITVRYNSSVQSIHGNGTHVTHLTIHDSQQNHEYDLETDALFIAIGLTPNTALFKDQLALTPHGYLQLHDITKTSVEGIFGAGDIADYRYRQAITAAGAGCMAALDAERYLKSMAYLKKN